MKSIEAFGIDKEEWMIGTDPISPIELCWAPADEVALADAFFLYDRMDDGSGK